jgi:hypothetical protein
LIAIAERDRAAVFRASFNAYASDTSYVSPMLSDLKRLLSARTKPLFASDQDFSFLAAMQVADGNPAFLRHAETSGVRSLHRLHLYSKAL